ncbi:MAG TPA: hypothetical protein VFP54_01590 [Acidimicrobiales bacterium]|nr:hypothetical protein [Acidimicrobiales bacterium]
MPERRWWRRWPWVLLLLTGAAGAAAVTMAGGSSHGALDATNTRAESPGPVPLTPLPTAVTTVPAPGTPGPPPASAVTLPSTTTTTVAATTTTTTIRSSPAVALDQFVAAEAARWSVGPKPAGWRTGFVSVHSDPVADEHTTVAVAAFSYTPEDLPVQILTYGDAGWSVTASLPPPHGLGSTGGLFLAADGPVTVGDVTGDGRPDFLLDVSAAGDTPGVVVSQDPNGWRYVPNAGPYPASDVVNGQPRLLDGHLVSDFNDCSPNCAVGHLATMVWSYQAATGVFTAPSPPGWNGGRG